MTLPRILWEDFNIARYHEERIGGNGNGQDGESFNNLVQEFQLIDILILDGMFTWSNPRDDPSLARLNRIMVSSY